MNDRDFGRLEGKVDGVRGDVADIKSTVTTAVADLRADLRTAVRDVREDAARGRDDHEMRLRALEGWRNRLAGSWKTLAIAGVAGSALLGAGTALLAGHL